MGNEKMPNSFATKPAGTNHVVAPGHLPGTEQPTAAATGTHKVPNTLGSKELPIP